mgnify:CR=1 FL=1
MQMNALMSAFSQQQDDIVQRLASMPTKQKNLLDQEKAIAKKVYNDQNSNGQDAHGLANASFKKKLAKVDSDREGIKRLEDTNPE